ncbi:MAG: hypothetical protein CMN69_03915 [Sphingomonadaceae bacterium]|nr:hypothetical protein [Sphingomonadaceae bacterium]|tara:strand:+ start:1038 stop:2732 length:1695 start_codon:yes stop_codon:yes gene_type:complete
MNRRCLIAIGCDRYERIGVLQGAETDAKRVYEALIPADVGDYDAAGSQLLLSPTLAEIRGALAEILAGGPIETFTLYFAGHGGVKSGTYYLLPRDAQLELLSATALSAAEILAMVAEAAPGQTNLIIDACEGGGLAGDVRSLLRPEDLGAEGTPGVTVLAMAARAQAAIEVVDGGVGTTALLDCVSGRTFVSDVRPGLDLVEIGTRVAETLAREADQSPVLWGLNLFGPRRFCANPRFGGSGGSLRATLGNWGDSATDAAVEAGMPKLWRAWDTLDDANWTPRSLIDAVSPVLASLPSGEARANLLDRLAAATDLRAANAIDRLRAIDARAACLAATLPHALDPAVADLIRADVLPAAEAPTLRRLLDIMLVQAPNSLVAVSDLQSAPVACIIAAGATGASTQTEIALGHLFASLVGTKARIATAHVDPDRVLAYLMARTSGRFDEVRAELAIPSELMTAILRGAAALGIEDAYDPYLEELDGVELNAFLPADYDRFADDIVPNGVNAGYGIGRDVFTVDELETAWAEAPQPLNHAARIGALLAALVLPDRTPWFLLPRQNKEE